MGAVSCRAVFSSKTGVEPNTVPPTAPTTIDALFFFHRIVHVDRWKHEKRYHSDLDFTAGSRIGIAVMAVTKAWSLFATVLEDEIF